MTRALAAWDRFWFEPEETSTLALLRIVFGFLVLAWTLTLTHDAYDFFSPDGVLSTPLEFRPLGEEGVWSVLNAFNTKPAVVAVIAALVVGSVCLIAGLWTRLAALVVFAGIVSLERRNLFVFNSGDGLLKIMAFYLVLAPAGASLSLDRLHRARQRFWEFPARAPWALRLMQVQLSVIYVSTVWAKVRGVTWDDGTAVSYSLRVEDLGRFSLPLSVTESELFSNFMTYGTLAIELAVGILVWNRKLRPWVLGLGVALHLGIDYSLRVGFFSYAMLTLYLAFLPPDTARALVYGARDRGAHLLGRRLEPTKTGG